MTLSFQDEDPESETDFVDVVEEEGEEEDIEDPIGEVILDEEEEEE